MGRLQHAADPLEDDPQPVDAAPQPARSLVAPCRGRGTHLCLDVLEQPLAAVASSYEERQGAV